MNYPRLFHLLNARSTRDVGQDFTLLHQWTECGFVVAMGETRRHNLLNCDGQAPKETGGMTKGWWWWW